MIIGAFETIGFCFIALVILGWAVLRAKRDKK